MDITEKENKCWTCGKVYKRKGHLVRHVRWECGKEPQFTCDHCGHATKRKENLIMHMRIKHSGNNETPAKVLIKPYKCETCKRRYVTQSGLYNHTKYECGKQPSFFCKYCDYSAKQKGQLKRHLEYVHFNSDPAARYRCVKCGALYKRKHSLPHHIKYRCQKR